MKNQIAIKLTNVTKQYTIHHEKPTLVEKMVKGVRQLAEEKFLALHDVSLTIKKGEKVGIIGPNGSGKTTLLKIIAGITTPTSGIVETHGKIVSLIDLEAGFHPDLTGIQNIYLNGMLLGMSKYDITKKLDSIIRFADIGIFIDTPLFTYSQGMKLRLGFSIAIHANPDILLLDENIAIGDEDFQKKSNRTIEKYYKTNKTILIVSHWMDYVNANCQKVVRIIDGKILAVGEKDVLDAYAKEYI